jgi:hypothetical protein
VRSQYAAIMEYLTNLWSSSEVCDGQVEGCSEAEIIEIMQAQGVERLPLMYVEFLRHMGCNTAGLKSHLISYPDVMGMKSETFNLLRQPDIFVLSHFSDGDCAIYFRVTEDDDPILYLVDYDYYPDLNRFDLLKTKELGRLSEWLMDRVQLAINAHEKAEMVKQMLDEG